ncbi:hypothetical protein NEOLEDRAFT_930666 [Neolentinus lepideus HHB14362 ss-1]|uniref:Uncharacterized protein n=1 Tax=Neolentinus lepideus HHB14362 ss-1 TaxID=1314782 RepID=A0A165NJF3_9AGAM|nr:hypothetical protein NEOLEDRAFT_930666 [Neolentinus lepideus HHB14362 ss-1]
MRRGAINRGAVSQEAEASCSCSVPTRAATNDSPLPAPLHLYLVSIYLLGLVFTYTTHLLFLACLSIHSASGFPALDILV